MVVSTARAPFLAKTISSHPKGPRWNELRSYAKTSAFPLKYLARMEGTVQPLLPLYDNKGSLDVGVLFLIEFYF